MTSNTVAMEEALPLEHPAYTTEVRRGWHGYTIRVNALRTLTPLDLKALIRRFMPGVTKSEHIQLANAHLRTGIEHKLEYSRALDAAAQETWGRPFEFLDYRISGIGSDEFTDARKTALRQHVRQMHGHHRLAIGHYMAAGLRHFTALDRCHAQGW